MNIADDKGIHKFKGLNFFQVGKGIPLVFSPPLIIVFLILAISINNNFAHFDQERVGQTKPFPFLSVFSPTCDAHIQKGLSGMKHFSLDASITHCFKQTFMLGEVLDSDCKTFDLFDALGYERDGT